MSEKSKLWYKTNAVVRFGLARSSRWLGGQYVLNEYPKCGGSWAAQMLSEASGIAFPRLEFPGWRRNILHGHFLSPFGIERPLIVWRDPRDLLVSHFFHTYSFNSMTSSTRVLENRKKIGLSSDSEIDFALCFPRYLESLSSRLIHPYFTLIDFYNEWWGKSECTHTSYERFTENPLLELREISRSWLGVDLDEDRGTEIVERYSFSRQSGRNAGVENTNSYLRKGIVGDWRSYLNDDLYGLVDGQYGKVVAEYIVSDLYREHWARS